MDKFDVVVIGSGCGGSPIAGNLAAAGAKVCVLERGCWWGPLQGKQRFPENISEFFKCTRGIGLSLPFLKKYIDGNRITGLFEYYFVMNGYIVIIPSGVGGGSLVVGGFVDTPPDDYFSRFPPEVTMREMESHYKFVADVIEPNTVIDDTAYGMELKKACAKISEISINPMKISVWLGNVSNIEEQRTNSFGCIQKNCNYKAQCFTGCNRGSKNSMDITFLQLVLKNSGEIRELSEAFMIRNDKRGYSVDYVDILSGEIKTISAAKLVIAAGAMNTMKLLFSSRSNNVDGLVNISRQLGKSWGFNGDMLDIKFLKKNKKVDHSQGTCLFSYHEIKSNKFQFDFHQFAFRTALLSWLPKPFNILSNRMMPFLSLSREDPIGCISYDGKVLKVNYPPQNGHKRSASAQKRVAVEVDSELEKKSDEVKKIKRGWGSVHPTGGAIIGRNIDYGVVNHAGEVFNYPGLYISDASILPGGTCCGPHFTIMALSNRMSRLIIDKEK